MRLDVEKMQIVRGDTLFAKFVATIGGKTKKHHYALPLGCGNGKFSINLSGTGVKLNQTWKVQNKWIHPMRPPQHGKVFHVRCFDGCKECGPESLPLYIKKC